MRTGSAARTRLMLKPRADVARAGRFRLHRGLAATIMPAMRPSRLAIAASLLLLLVSLTVAGTWLWGRHALETGIARWRAEQIERGYTIRSEEHTSELQSLMRTSSAVFCLKK